ncbi:MAG: site-specific integrase [Methanomassiliicoccus sp.]|nr:site-specific integrase [Methanomassiliicoccus sp.]
MGFTEMPSKERRLGDAVENFLETKRKKKRPEQTIKGYRWMIKKVNRALTEAGYDPYPNKWTEDTVNFLLDDVYCESQPGVVRREFSILNSYLMFHGNDIKEKMELEWQEDERKNVHWLTFAQARTIEQEAKGFERIVVHLELHIGLRRVEVLRLTVKDIQMGYFNVLGKGRRGGKWRQNPFDPETNAELNHFFELRDMEIRKARAKNPAVVVPDNLLIYERGGELFPYKRTAVDGMLKRIQERTGVEFSNHVLRRQFAKELHMSGEPISKISELLGHKDEKTTKLYIGIDMDQKVDSMNRLAQWRAQQTAQMGLPQNRGIFDEASKVSGQSGNHHSIEPDGPFSNVNNLWPFVLAAAC